MMPSYPLDILTLYPLLGESIGGMMPSYPLDILTLYPLLGESIGGMMACHAARVCGADLLVCDRTFCSLDAVAARLLGVLK